MTYIGAHWGEIYQLSYITRDMDAALAHAESELGITSFNLSEPELDLMSFGKVEHLHLKAAMANIGPHQFEILQPIAGPTHIYTDEVDLDAHILNFHHIAVAITGDYANWEKLLADVRAAGDEFAFLAPHEPDPASPLAFCYVDTRARLGHYTEYMWWDSSLDGSGMVPNLKR